ncbi:MAG: hypothetical protein J5374_09425 [Bacteroidales bacterium]|nr:hypothetical protein [Bacteroidales bacterium]
MHRILALFFSFCFLALAVEAGAQRVTDSGYRAVAFIKPDGTIQDASYKIIGHAEGIPVRWTAFFFFFRT